MQKSIQPISLIIVYLSGIGSSIIFSLVNCSYVSVIHKIMSYIALTTLFMILMQLF